MDGTILLTEVSHTTESRIKEARNNNLLNETVEHKPNSHSGKSLRSTALKQAKSDPPPVFFLNKVLLEEGHAHLFMYGNFCDTLAELSSSDRGH